MSTNVSSRKPAKDPKLIRASNFLIYAERHYIAARDIWWRSFHWHSAFFMAQALENILKALLYQATNEQIDIKTENGKLVARYAADHSKVCNHHILSDLAKEIETFIPGFVSCTQVTVKSGVSFSLEDFEPYYEGARYPDSSLHLPFELIEAFDAIFFNIREHFKFGSLEERQHSPIQVHIEEFADPEFPEFRLTTLAIPHPDTLERQNSRLSELKAQYAKKRSS